MAMDGSSGPVDGRGLRSIAATSAGDGASPGALDGGRPVALVAASDAQAQDTCRSVLEADLWQVVVVDSGVAAVIAARHTAPSVIFVDLQLRDVPGREAVGWLRSNHDLSAVPIVVIAGGAEDDSEIAGIDPSALLRKPLSRRAVERVAAGLIR